jgi:hypothetical protein
MSTIVMVILVYHRYKPIDFILVKFSQFSSIPPWKEVDSTSDVRDCFIPEYLKMYRSQIIASFNSMHHNLSYWLAS